VKGILFDYGHTLVHFFHQKRTNSNAIRNLKKVLRDLGVIVDVQRIQSVFDGYAYRPDNVVSMQVEFKEIFDRFGVENYNNNDVQQAIDGYWKPYIRNARVRKGVKTLLTSLTLKELRLGIVSNIWSGGMNPVLQREGLYEYFHTVVASIDVGFNKPDPRIFQIALSQLQLNPHETVMVGDNPEKDILGAHKLGITTVRLLRGPHRGKPDVVKSDYKIGNLRSLISIIEGLT